MDNQQAKFILSAYRPDGQDAGDASFAEALQQAERDPDLKEWFADQREFDALFSRKLREVEVPSDLKDMIFAAEKITPIATLWQRPTTYYSALAAVLVALLIGIFAFQAGFGPAAQPLAWSDYQNTVLARIQGPHLSLRTDNLERVRAFLASHDGGVNDFVLPASLQERPAVGCCIWKIEGKPATLVCFTMEDGSVGHLVMTKRDNLVDAPEDDTPSFEQVGQWNLARWTERNTSYILAVKREIDINRLFEDLDSRPLVSMALRGLTELDLHAVIIRVENNSFRLQPRLPGRTLHGLQHLVRFA